MTTPENTAASIEATKREGRLHAEEVQLQDQRLDEELEQSFPASDPLPWHHDIDMSARAAIVVDGQQSENTHEPAAKA